MLLIWFMSHWETAVTATAPSILIRIPLNPAKSTCPAETIWSTARPVRIGTYRVRATVIKARSRDRMTLHLYWLIYLRIRFRVSLLLLLSNPFLLLIPFHLLL